MEASRVLVAAIVLLFAVVTSAATELENTWCVPRSTASDAALVMSIERACSQGGDCAAIQPGSRCFNGNLAFQAAYAMNSAFKKAGGHPSNCDYNGVGHMTHIYPGTPACVFM